VSAFSLEGLEKELKYFNFDSDYLPAQHSLGITWSLHSDNLGFRLAESENPFTRRGVLSVVNSLFHPLSFAATVITPGKLYLQKATQGKFDWDDPLPSKFES
jgi:hypothetical protein